MKCNYFILISILSLFAIASCYNDHKRVDLIVYPEYCKGCVSKNFFILKNKDFDKYVDIYFDTTDVFLLNTAKLNDLSYNHIDNDDVFLNYGDYANVVVSKNGHVTELKTNEVIEKGKHF